MENQSRAEIIEEDKLTKPFSFVGGMIPMNPKNGSQWNNKGYAFHNLKRYNEAIECYEKGLNINPNYDVSWNNKGLTFNSLKIFDDIQDFE